MATAAQVAQQRRAQRKVANLASNRIASLWPRLPLDSPKDMRTALAPRLVATISTFSRISGAVAADYFDELRRDARAAGTYAAAIAAPVSVERITNRMGWALSPLYNDGDAVAPVSRLVSIVDEYVLQGGRDTIAHATARDPSRPRYARVPSGSHTCAFCQMLASRGAVYRSPESAGGYGARYHYKCDCVPTPFWDESPYPDGYNPDALFEQYDSARREADSGDIHAIAAAYRAAAGTN